jgi:hypothetical protein
MDMTRSRTLLAVILALAVPATMAAAGLDPQAVAAEALIPQGAPTRTVDTIDDMLGSTPLEDGLYFVVRGYHRPDDDGGGVFTYEAAGNDAADRGTVLQPNEGPGRFKRVFDAEGDVHAEWFGAYGDGDSEQPHDDKDAINACLAAFGRVKLLAKTYGVRGKPTHYNPNATYHAIDLGPNYKIEGAGRKATRIKLLDGSNPKGSTPGENYFNVLANRDFYESADHVVIRDLTIDCNFDGQNKHTTINAIGIRGGDALVERVNFRGYGTGRHPETGSSRECFVTHQTLVYKDEGASRKAATYRDLDFTDCGHNGSLEGNVGEITHITLGGADNFHNKGWILRQGHDPDWDPENGGENENNWWPSVGGLVENCVVHDETYDPSVQKSPLHGITYGDCIGLVVRNNRIERFEGAAVFVMSWWNRDTTITDNEFIGVSSGAALHIKGQDGEPLQAPYHEKVLFERNRIELCAPKHNPYSPIGVQLYGQSLGEGIRFKSMVVRNNTIKGRAYTDTEGKQRFPVGIVVQILHANYSKLLFEGNRIDIPDYSPGPYVPQEPYSMSMLFFPLARWDEDTRTDNVIFRDNRNSDGKLLRPILADWYFKNEPTWGMPKEGAAE